MLASGHPEVIWFFELLSVAELAPGCSLGPQAFLAKVSKPRGLGSTYIRAVARAWCAGAGGAGEWALLALK